MLSGASSILAAVKILLTDVVNVQYKAQFVSEANGLRPYHAESTGSRPITEVKPRRAWLVLGWATALEPQVL